VLAINTVGSGGDVGIGSGEGEGACSVTGEDAGPLLGGDGPFQRVYIKANTSASVATIATLPKISASLLPELLGFWLGGAYGIV